MRVLLSFFLAAYFSPALAQKHAGTNRVVSLAPKAATAPSQTHAALMTSQSEHAYVYRFQGRVQTVRTLRVGSPPNPWECAWLVWGYTDNDHFYYLAVKPNGWELGKRDPYYPGGQRFLATGPTPYKISEWHTFSIDVNSATITASLNGAKVASFTDFERPYYHGKVGIYTEDAEVYVDDIESPLSEDFQGYAPQKFLFDGAFLGTNWVFPFLGYGEAAIVDVKKR